MQKFLHRYTAIFLAILLALCLLPAAALADGEAEAPEPVYEEPAYEPEPEPAPEPEAEPEPELSADPVEPAGPAQPEGPSAEEPEDAAPAELPEEPSELVSTHITEDEDGLYEIPFSDFVVGGYYEFDENEVTICYFLMDELGLNSAAACGVLGNAVVESEFSPWCLGDEGTSYGVFQWHNDRFVDLRSWCMASGWDYTSLEGQLQYLAYELEYCFPGVLSYLLSVPNSADGAYDAAYYWCTHYEMPANMNAQGDYRGRLAAEVYWPYYGCYALTFDGNGGSVAADTIYVMGDGVYGELPVPVRNFFEFEGWFTQPEDGEEAVKVVEGEAVTLGWNATLYARWSAEDGLADSPMFLEQEEGPDEIVAQLLAEAGYPDMARYTFSF